MYTDCIPYIFNPFLTRVERCRARANTSFRFEGARITLLQFCASLQSACTIAENSESVRKSNLTAKISFVLAYRALVPLYKTQNQIHPAPQAKILRICTSKCKILPAPQAIFLPIYTSQMQNPIGNRHIRGAKTQKFENIEDFQKIA